MQPHIITGAGSPEEKQQQALYQRLGEFMDDMKRPKDAAAVARDTLQPVPVAQLPMVF